VETCNPRLAAAVLFLGSLLGGVVAYTATLDTSSDDARESPIITATTKARNIVPLAIPPRENYGAPYVRSQVHPVLVAAAIGQISFFALLLFPVARKTKVNRQPIVREAPSLSHR
jgi:hypothetical protein